VSRLTDSPVPKAGSGAFPGLRREDGRPGVPLVPSGPLAELTAAGLVVAGAALVIWAYSKARTAEIQSYDLIFWAGMLLAYLAIGWRAVSGRYAVPWLGVLGLFTLLPKFWMSPSGPIYYDEIAHFSLLRSVIVSGQLFRYTPLLPIGRYYPGLESAAATIHWLTGLSPWDSALTLIAVAHCLLPVQVYYIARALPVSHRWAAVAGLVYATNPSFVYDDVQFAYESAAILLMLTIVRLYVESLAAERSGDRTWRQSLAAVLLIAVISFGCVVTHHLTTLAGLVLLLVGALLLKPISGLADRNGGWRRLFVRWTPVLTLAMCLGLWIAFVAPGTVSYLFPWLSGPTSKLLALVGIGHGAKSGGVRAPFSQSVIPGYERFAAFAAPTLIALALLFAGIRWLSERPLRSNFLWPFVLAAAYLVSLPLTLIAGAAAGAHRTWVTTYVGVSLLPAALVTLFALDKQRPQLKHTAAAVGAAALAVLLVGNVAAGTPVDYRFPGPYQFGSDTLSVTPETVSFAHWVQAHLGSRAGVVTDRFTALALTADADAVTPREGAKLPISNIWYNRRPPTPALMSAMQRRGDDYLAIDVRDAQHAAVQPPLFFPGDPKVVPLANITRLARWPWLRLLYSSAHYRLYKIDYHLYDLWYPSHAKDQ
jgi:hypothetical protein